MSIEIISLEREGFSDNYNQYLFEQYKMYLEMADRISLRRQSANTFFLSLNTALVALTSYAKSSVDVTIFHYLLTSLSGIFLCYVWYRLVLSYKNLNSAKFKVIHEIEKLLPLKLFEAEWEAVGRGKNKALYHPFTNLEMKVPWIFTGVYALSIAYIIPWCELLSFLSTKLI
ncbi:hypothetical protein DU977_14240 [Vibrio cholerae]|nr:hypothetical protein [Vibrio cholerae]EJL6742697.1 hypothetical protein [Vibrio cholerae]